MPQITPLRTLTLVRTWYAKSPHEVFNELLNAPNNSRQFFGAMLLWHLGPLRIFEVDGS